MLRIPAGVYVDGVALGGRFVSPGALPGLVSVAEGDGPERLLAIIYAQADRATRRHERAERLFDDDPKRYATRREAAESERGEWDAIVEQAESLFQDEEESFAEEWEIGFGYEASQGRGSDVDVNIRIRRIDRQEMGQTEAAATLRAFRERLSQGSERPIPAGYQLASINWRRPNRSSGWRPRGGSGTMQDLENFNSPMYTGWGDEGAWSIEPFGPVRMGSVKQ